MTKSSESKPGQICGVKLGTLSQQADVRAGLDKRI
jgi:hypothetical protein